LQSNFFSRQFFFFGILEKENLSEQKKIGGKKIHFAKKFFNFAKKVIRFNSSIVVVQSNLI
jgi:hypothetical protein